MFSQYFHVVSQSGKSVLWTYLGPSSQMERAASHWPMSMERSRASPLATPAKKRRPQSRCPKLNLAAPLLRRQQPHPIPPALHFHRHHHHNFLGRPWAHNCRVGGFDPFGRVEEIQPPPRPTACPRLEHPRPRPEKRPRPGRRNAWRVGVWEYWKADCEGGEGVGDEGSCLYCFS